MPILDASTTVFSLIAQWLTCRKIIENWIFWFVIDATYIVLYFYKGLYVHAHLQIVYLAMAGIGYYYWNRQLEKNL